jgi:hypothetical protein
MRLGPWIALKLTAGIAALALSVRGWHSPELTVAGGALLLRTGFDLARTRPTKAPPDPASSNSACPAGWSGSVWRPRRLVGRRLAGRGVGQGRPAH